MSLREKISKAIRATSVFAPSTEMLDAILAAISSEPTHPPASELAEAQARIAELEATVAKYDKRIVGIGAIALNSVSREVYEAAVKGRQDFRNDVRELRTQLAAAQAALKVAQQNIAPRRPNGSSDPESPQYDHDAFLWDFYGRALATDKSAAGSEAA